MILVFWRNRIWVSQQKRREKWMFMKNSFILYICGIWLVEQKRTFMSTSANLWAEEQYIFSRTIPMIRWRQTDCHSEKCTECKCHYLLPQVWVQRDMNGMVAKEMCSSFVHTRRTRNVRDNCCLCERKTRSFIRTHCHVSYACSLSWSKWHRATTTKVKFWRERERKK